MCKVALCFMLMVFAAISLTDAAFARNASPEDGGAQEVRFGGLIVTSPGRAYSKAQIVRNSHYPEPISQASGRLAGRSRRWGDASVDVQQVVIDRIISYCSDYGFSTEETCFAIALCRLESGFNPDAAAGTTSAAGLCQVIDATRQELCRRAGLRNTDPFDADVNLVCLCEALREAFVFAERKVGRSNSTRFFCMVYAYHHDGPSLKYGGYELAEKRLIPWLETAKGYVIE